MEFEAAKTIDDDARRLAAAKRLTITPLHSDIAPEPLPESEDSARSASDPAPENIAIDTEIENTMIQPSEGVLRQSDIKTSHTIAYIVTGLVTLSVAVTAGLLMTN